MPCELLSLVSEQTVLLPNPRSASDTNTTSWVASGEDTTVVLEKKLMVLLLVSKNEICYIFDIWP